MIPFILAAIGGGLIANAIGSYNEKYAKGGLIAPNGKESNLTPEQYKLVRTPAFKSWFGDWENDPENSSKVVDENGEPKVVYHGSKNEFYIFEKAKIGSNTDDGLFGRGFYFSKNVKTSQHYGEYVKELFLNIRTPFNVGDFKDKKEVAEKLNIDEDILTEGGSGFRPYYSYIGIFTSSIKENGYDGVTTKYGEIVALYPTQIKLADGTNATFDANNPDIRFAVGGSVNDGRRQDYLKWKRKNVTLRGISELGEENGGMGKYGSGLYTAFLGNKQMAKEYGEVYFVLNAIPKNPKVLSDVNGAEMFIQNVINNWCKERGMSYNSNKFYEETNIRYEMIKLGYDGLVIKGREMVNYTPSKDVRYYENEEQLEQYYYNQL